MPKSLCLNQLAEMLDGELRGEGGSRNINGIAALEHAQPDQISFYTGQQRYRQALRNTRAAAVLLRADAVRDCPVDCIILENPYLGYARSSRIFAETVAPLTGVHASAVVEDGAVIDPAASIGAHCFIGSGARVGAVCLDPGVYLGRGVQIGDGSHLYASVVVHADVCLGRRVVVHAGTVLGADGFGFVFNGSNWEKISQLGSVQIGDDVEIGANTTVDRGSLGETRIESGVKIDNQVHIAHNVYIGKHTVIAGCTGIAGSTRIGARCCIGGGCGISNGLCIADDVEICAGSTVYKNLPVAGSYASGARLQTTAHWHRTYAGVPHISAIPGLLRRLERLERLEKTKR